MKKRLLWGAAALICAAAALVTGYLLQQKRRMEPLTPFLSGEYTAAEETPLAFSQGEILRYRVNVPGGEARAWVFPDGAVFWCQQGGAFQMVLDGFSRAVPLGDDAAPVLCTGEGGTVLIQPPLAREGRGTEYLAQNEDNGTVCPVDGGIEICFAGENADWWAYLTAGELSAEMLTLCSVEKFGGENRMTLDGYFYTTPSDYIPSGEGTYYRNPAAFIAAKLARQSGDLQGRQLAAAMLDIQRQYFEEAGYMPTLPASGWLSRDYGIGAGFFDTRFNTDLATALLVLGQEMEIPEFTEQALRYAAFLVDHARTNAIPTGNGIMVGDYAHPAGNPVTHSSLNHQLSEILFLRLTGEPAAVAAADAMLRAVEDTAESWIRADGNLHYAMYPDGSFGGSDYPYLTYNDLLALWEHLCGNEALERLMDSKRDWMDRNGITQYRKPEENSENRFE